MDQQDRLEYLVEQFIQESPEYRNIRTDGDADTKRRLLRSLMNVRMPRRTDEAVLRVQDEYLQERALQKGIVSVDEIPTLQALGSRCAEAEKLSLWQGDITRLAADAIVNAANTQMLGCFVPMHNCIDNCIHTYAGVQLRAECGRQMDRLRGKFGPDYEQPTAVPMLTDAYNLPARKVIHIVGPIVYGALTLELEQDLADCYRNVLDLCAANGLRSVAFCCISTGVFRFPNGRAAEIAVRVVTEWLGAHPGAVDRVIFNVFKDEDRRYYEQLLL